MNATETHWPWDWKRLIAAALIAMWLCSEVGCATYHDTDAFVMDPLPPTIAARYTVAPPDLIQIRADQVPEINGLSMVVSPDGHIVLPLLGEMYVAGLTASQIADQIAERSREYYHEVDVVVHVTGYRSKHLYVFGEVARPGRYSYTGADTVLDVLALAQPSRLADPNRIQVLRPSADGDQVHRMTIELDEWVKHGHTDRNALLAEGDILYVPPNGLARVGLAVKQLLLPISPAAQVVAGPVDIDQSVGSAPYNGRSGNSGP